MGKLEEYIEENLDEFWANQKLRKMILAKRANNKGSIDSILLKNKEFF